MCPVENCDKSYTDPSSLRKHIKTVHGEETYEVAKKNKAANGRGGNYGHIPLTDLPLRLREGDGVKESEGSSASNSPCLQQNMNPSNNLNQMNGDSPNYLEVIKAFNQNYVMNNRPSTSPTENKVSSNQPFSTTHVFNVSHSDISRYINKIGSKLQKSQDLLSTDSFDISEKLRSLGLRDDDEEHCCDVPLTSQVNDEEENDLYGYDTSTIPHPSTTITPKDFNQRTPSPDSIDDLIAVMCQKEEKTLRTYR